MNLKKNLRRLSLAVLVVSALALGQSSSYARTDALAEGFNAPPQSAKPQTWWHWMNGNITQEGIRADLEAMQQIGLGGATIVNADCGIPRGSVPFMSPEWRECFKFAVEEADRLGLKLAVENCAGWSSSGGPWNTPEHGMQRLTSSQVPLQGPAVYQDLLPQPPTNLKYYRDIAVLAFPTPRALLNEDELSSTPGKLEITRALFRSKSTKAGGDVKAKIEELIQSGQTSVQANTTVFGDPIFGEVKELLLEFKLDGVADSLCVNENDLLIFPLSTRVLAEAKMRKKTSVDETFFSPAPSTLSSGKVIAFNDIIDLTDKMGPDGRLNWEVPAGDWTVLRMGYTPIGRNNHPAPKEGTGLECDKMSKEALDAHWEGFMAKVLADIGPLAGKSLDTSLIDSYEVGLQDWTANFRQEFIKRRGYDPIKYLPSYTRDVVESVEQTERFLWDMRRTISDLFAENYFGHFDQLCQENGLLSAVEPYTGPFESIQCGKDSDVVMGEFWSGSQGHGSVKLAASIAHTYGKTIVGAESFTATPDAGKWQNDPYTIKALGDLMFAQGLNRYIFHRYAMQPWMDRYPGMTMGQWGFHFDRTTTWWEQGKAWIDYISRCEYLLQQGRAVADIAYFTGESSPVEMRTAQLKTHEGYDYDAVCPDVLLKGATVKKGRLTLKSGANYAVLVLPADDINMTPQMLKCISSLVKKGATVVGPRPQHSPSLSGYPQCDEQVAKLTSELWGNVDGVKVFENKVGKGRVLQSVALTNIFKSQNLKPDFESTSAQSSSKIAYTHRVSGKDDIYFVSNQRKQFDTVECTFRVSGKIPELWFPDTGVIQNAALWSQEDGRTKVQLSLEPAGSVFVLFRKPAPREHIVAWETQQGPITTPEAPKLEIKKAVYTAIDGAGSKDVTTIVASRIKDGELNLSVVNDTFGGDPADLHKKELRVDYTLNGKAEHILVPEHDTLLLPVPRYVDQAPKWEIFVDAKGEPSVKAWENGTVTLHSAQGKTLSVEVTGLAPVQTLKGDWSLSFPPNWGAPASVQLPELISWTEHSEAGVRYFSGTATYRKEFQVSAQQLAQGQELWLDLGEVKNFAQVTLNGHELDVLWKPPFRVEVSQWAKVGSNELEVEVTNLWPNRLIGDAQLPEDCQWNGVQLAQWPQWVLEGKPSPTGRLTFTTWKHWDKDSKLLTSGLLGPVSLKTVQVKKVH